MIILDTHVFVWWIDGNEKLPSNLINVIKSHETDGLGVSIISIWEIAKLYEKTRLNFQCSLDEWFDKALKYPGIMIADLTMDIILDSTRLPGKFHNDPADQMIVSTARTMNVPLCSLDKKILEYPHVKLVL